MGITNREVAHRWAQRNGAAVGSGNLYCRGDKLYSYGSHFVVARHVEAGERWVVFLNSRSYSVSTSRHQSYASRAASHLERFWLPNPTASVREALDYYRDRLSDILREYAGTTSRHTRLRPAIENNARSVVDDFNRLRELSGSRRKPLELPTDFLEASAAIAKRDRNVRARAESTGKRRAAKRERELLRLVDDWKAGENVEISELSKVYLRIRGELVWTSHGANFPLSHGLRILGRLRGVRILSESVGGAKAVWRGRDADAPMRLGHYQIDKIDASGVIAGCHRIEWDEIDRIVALVPDAATLGFSAVD